mgnify:FL=1
MDQTDKMRKISGGSPQTGALYILRIATIVLAVVSWWSTAQGMADYVFQEKVAGIPGFSWGTGDSAGIEFLPADVLDEHDGVLLQANRPGQPESCYPVLFFCFYLYLHIRLCI